MGDLGNNIQEGIGAKQGWGRTSLFIFCVSHGNSHMLSLLSSAKGVGCSGTHTELGQSEQLEYLQLVLLCFVTRLHVLLAGPKLIM